MVRGRLGDLLRVKHGFAFDGAQFDSDPSLPTIVTPGNFAVGGGFKASKVKTYSGVYDTQWELAPGSAIISMTDLSKAGDTLGSWALVPSDGTTYLHNQRVGLARILPNASIDLRYLAYRTRLPDYRAYVIATATGTTVRHTSPGRIESFLLDLPSLGEQRAIAEVLGALDDKIAANDRLVSTLNQLASAAFRERSDSTVRLTSIARFVNGKNFTKGASGSGRVVVRIAEMNSGIGGSTVYSDADVPEENLVRPGDVLFAWSGSLTVQRWSRPEAIVNQHIFKVVPELGVPKWVVYEALLTQLPEFRAIAAGKATTMGHIQRRHLEVDVAVPSVEVIEDLHELMQGMWDRALAADQESRTLAELRDTLLPALMDGTIRVKDAVTAAEEVL